MDDTVPEVVERVEVPLIQKASDDLAKLNATTGLGRANNVNRAISLYAYISEALAQGDTLVLRHPDGSGHQVHIS